MSKKESKVSIIKMQKILDFQKVAPVVLKFETSNEPIEVDIKYSIDKDEKARFIFEVVNSCFIDDTYLPIYRDELFDIAILEHFTNIKVDTTETNIMNIVVNSDVVEKVKIHINSKQLKSIRLAIENLIEYRKSEILAGKENVLNQAIGKLESFVEACSGLDKIFESDTAQEVLTASKKLAKVDEHKTIDAIIDNLNDHKVTDTPNLSVY